MSKHYFKGRGKHESELDYELRVRAEAQRFVTVRLKRNKPVINETPKLGGFNCSSAVFGFGLLGLMWMGAGIEKAIGGHVRLSLAGLTISLIFGLLTIPFAWKGAR